MWNDVVAIYRASKKRKDINWWTEWVCRPPAAVVVYFLRSTAVTPNQVTFLSAVVAAGSGLMFALLPGHLWLVLAALVFEFSFVLDCADGQLARLRRVSSPLGHLLDFLMDELKAMFVFACVAYRLWHGTGEDIYLVAGLGGLFALASGLTLTSFMRRPEYGAPPPTADGQPAVVTSRRGPLGLVVTALEHGARIVVHYPSYIWLVALADRIDIYFWAYAAVNVLYLARCLLSVFLRLGRFQPAAPAVREDVLP
jgi:phosphatidylglycerophosphate synthase